MFSGLPHVAREALAELGPRAAGSAGELGAAVAEALGRMPDPVVPEAVDAVFQSCDDHVDPSLDRLPPCTLPAVAKLGLFEPTIHLMDDRCQFCPNCRRVLGILSEAGLPDADDAEPITVNMVVESFIEYVMRFRETLRRREDLFQKLRQRAPGSAPLRV